MRSDNLLLTFFPSPGCVRIVFLGGSETTSQWNRMSTFAVKRNSIKTSGLMDLHIIRNSLLPFCHTSVLHDWNPGLHGLDLILQQFKNSSELIGKHYTLRLFSSSSQCAILSSMCCELREVTITMWKIFHVISGLKNWRHLWQVLVSVQSNLMIIIVTRYIIQYFPKWYYET